MPATENMRTDGGWLIRNSDEKNLGWGQKCDTCNHSRADHAVLNSEGEVTTVASLNAFSGCNIVAYVTKNNKLPADLPCNCERFVRN